MPASLASFDMLTTIACSAKVASVPGSKRQPVGNAPLAAAVARAASAGVTAATSGRVDGLAGDGAAPGCGPRAHAAVKNAAQTAIGRNGALEDLYGATIFLASDASSYITGQTLYIDGGFTAK